jgi:DNA polymerase III subunit chi
VGRVDFYVLSDTAPDAIWRCACRLIEKAFDLNHRVYVHVASAADAQRLDELLWTFSDRSFIPHHTWTGEDVPHDIVKVLIGERPGPASHRDVLVNLSGTVPANIDAYARVAEVVDTDAERKRLSRERYKQYRERGCILETHNL